MKVTGIKCGIEFGRNPYRAVEQAQKVLKAINTNPDGFFESVLSDKLVLKYLKAIPDTDRQMLETFDFSGSLGRAYPDVYKKLEGHNNGLLNLSKQYMEILGKNPTPEQWELIEASAKAHDVGKAFATAETWNTRGTNPFVEHFIKKHPDMGGMIMETIGAPKEVAIFTKGHHSQVGDMETALLQAKVEKPVKFGELVEIMKGGDMVNAMRTPYDELRDYRPQPLDWLRTYKCLDDEVFGRKRLRQDVFRAAAINDFGQNPTEQDVYKMLQSDDTKGYFLPDEVRKYLVNKFNKQEAADASREGLLEMCTKLLHAMVKRH